MGNQQIAFNYMLANAPGATVLPFPRYACFEPGVKGGEHMLLQFIGTYRYDDGAYRRLAIEFIDRYSRLPGGEPA
jgi:hypothetical protein